MPGEFDIIKRFFAPLCGPEALGLTDDAALLKPPTGYDMVVTTDTLIEGVHFRPQDPVELIAHKVLAVSVSDCVAKAAKPAHYFLSLSLPDAMSEHWLTAFSAGLSSAQSLFGCSLSGGDTTRSPGQLVITITLVGLVKTGDMVRRTGAQSGDNVYVTGTLGDAAFGLWCLQEDDGRFPLLVEAYQKPLPPWQFGINLASWASSSADISDGLIADCGHIADASGILIELVQKKLPVSQQANELLGRTQSKKHLIWSGGDDYQIIFTAGAAQHANILDMAMNTNTRVTCIGAVKTGSGVHLLDSEGETVQVTSGGYTHF